jgi:hypothetical protein
MKQATPEFLTISTWGLHISSFIMASMPYLQTLSLLLAITVSIFTLRKLVKDERRKRRG